MSITPDTKDWTWVLERPCPECGLDAGAVDPRSVPQRVRENAAAWQQVLARPTGVGERPGPGVWSALEYACHVRDVFTLFAERLQLMLTATDPVFPNWDQDAAAVEQRYDLQDPAIVGTELVAAAEAVADRFGAVGDDQWQRAGRRSDGARFTVASFARYFIHDPVHHLHDVTDG